MSVLRLPLVKWGTVVLVVLGILNVITRPSPTALAPTVDIQQLIADHRQSIAAEIDSGAPQPPPKPIPAPPQPAEPTPLNPTQT